MEFFQKFLTHEENVSKCWKKWRLTTRDILETIDSPASHTRYAWVQDERPPTTMDFLFWYLRRNISSLNSSPLVKYIFMMRKHLPAVVAICLVIMNFCDLDRWSDIPWWRVGGGGGCKVNNWLMEALKVTEYLCYVTCSEATPEYFGKNIWERGSTFLEWNCMHWIDLCCRNCSE